MAPGPDATGSQERGTAEATAEAPAAASEPPADPPKPRVMGSAEPRTEKEDPDRGPGQPAPP